MNRPVSWRFMLNTGRFVESVAYDDEKTGGCRLANKTQNQPYVEIHPKDARQLGIEDKSLRRLTRLYGSGY